MTKITYPSTPKKDQGGGKNEETPTTTPRVIIEGFGTYHDNK